MTALKILRLIGGLLFVAGLIVGFIPVSSQGANCGSAFVKSDDAHVSDLTATLSGGFGTTGAAAACDSLRSVLLIPVITLLVIGGVLGLVGMILAGQSQPAKQPAETEA